MPARLFVVHGSHPCAAVEKALELKGIPYKVFEWTPPTHAVGQRLIFGGRTVPGIRFEGGERARPARDHGRAGPARPRAPAVSRRPGPRGRPLGRAGPPAGRPADHL